MKFIDSYGLPGPLKRAIEWQSNAHSVGEANISCTSLIDSPLVRYLWRVYSDQIVIEYASRLWPLFGSIAHMIVEKFGDKTEEHVERRVIAPFGDYKVSGGIDLIRSGKKLTDYKFTSTFAVGDGVKVEWERQENVYLGLLRHSANPIDREMGFNIDELEICAMLRDWGPRFKKDFPTQVKMLNVKIWDSLRDVAPENIPVWTDIETTKYIRERIQLHRDAESKPEMPPQCSEGERWIKPEAYAVVKQGRKSAVKLFKLSDYPCEREAEAAAAQHIQGMGDKAEGCSVELRKSEPRRCIDYCDVAQFCPYYQQAVKEQERGGEASEW